MNQARSERMKKQWQDPAFRAKMCRPRTEEQKANMRAGQALSLLDPTESERRREIGHRNGLTNAGKKRTPEQKVKGREATKEAMKDPGVRARIKAAANRPEVRAAKSQRMKQMWANWRRGEDGASPATLATPPTPNDLEGRAKTGGDCNRNEGPVAQ
jgi:hypothetical protein